MVEIEFLSRVWENHCFVPYFNLPCKLLVGKSRQIARVFSSAPRAALKMYAHEYHSALASTRDGPEYFNRPKTDTGIVGSILAELVSCIILRCISPGYSPCRVISVGSFGDPWAEIAGLTTKEWGFDGGSRSSLLGDDIYVCGTARFSDLSCGQWDRRNDPPSYEYEALRECTSPNPGPANEQPHPWPEHHIETG